MQCAPQSERLRAKVLAQQCDHTPPEPNGASAQLPDRRISRVSYEIKVDVVGNVLMIPIERI